MSRRDRPYVITTVAKPPPVSAVLFFRYAVIAPAIAFILGVCLGTFVTVVPGFLAMWGLVAIVLAILSLIGLAFGHD